MFAFPRVIRRRHDNGNVSEENVEEDASATTTTSSSRAGDDVEEEEEEEEEEGDPTAYLANFHFAPTHQQECQLFSHAARRKRLLEIGLDFGVIWV